MRDVGLVFAGGGNRAFYQLGLLRGLGNMLLPRVAAVAACSAGACVAITHFAGRQQETWDYWLSRVRGTRRNMDVRRWLRGQRLTPHYGVYRGTVLHTLADGGFERVRSQPFPILVLAATFPRLLPRSLAAVTGLGLYSAERMLRAGRLHPAFTRRVGFRPYVADARDCETPEQLTDLILASSATPPFTPIGRFGGRWLLDGGVVDNAPAFVAETAVGVGRTVVLLTRPYPLEVTGRQGRRLYLAPTVPPPTNRWDYTAPERVVATDDLGHREAEFHRPALEAFLAEPLLG